MKPFDDDEAIAALLAAARPLEEPPAEARARVKSRVAATLAATAAAGTSVVGIGQAAAGTAAKAGAGAAAKAGAGAAAKAGAAGLVTKLGLAVGLLGAGVAATYYAASALLPPKGGAPAASRSATPAPAVAAAPPVVAAPAPAVVSPPEPATPPVAAPAPPPRRAGASPRSSAPYDGDLDGPDRLASERSLIEAARILVGHKDGDGALRWLAAHARRYPRGRLAEEREGLWVRALLAEGRRDEARRRADAFHLRFPNSIFAPAIERLLAR